MNRAALITGANSDLGLEITKTFLREGFSVLGQYHSRPEALSSIKDPNFTSLQADLTDFAQAEALVKKAEEGYGGIDFLVNMIGPFSEEDIFSVTPAHWRSMVELNLNIAFTMTYYAKNPLVARKGQILNFCYAGVENIRGWPRSAPYAAAKAGLAVMTKSFAQAFAFLGVRVNAICPGYIDFGKFSDENLNSIEKEVPAGRLGTADEVTSVVRWLIKDSPAYLNGSFLSIGGAWEHPN